MKKEKKIINLSQLLSFGSILMVGIIFIHNFSYIMGLGLSSTFALIASAGYVGIPTIIAAVGIVIQLKTRAAEVVTFGWVGSGCTNQLQWL